jgi:hypothetical protein
VKRTVYIGNEVINVDLEVGANKLEEYIHPFIPKGEVLGSQWSRSIINIGLDEASVVEILRSIAFLNSRTRLTIHHDLDTRPLAVLHVPDYGGWILLESLSTQLEVISVPNQQAPFISWLTIQLRQQGLPGHRSI